MLNVGIDFGSTYTTVSVYQNDTKTIQVFSPGEGESAAIPTVLAIPPGDRRPLGRLPGGRPFPAAAPFGPLK